MCLRVPKGNYRIMGPEKQKIKIQKAQLLPLGQNKTKHLFYKGMFSSSGCPHGTS